MSKLNARQQKILSFFIQNDELQSSAVHKLATQAGEQYSLVTIKRVLSEMTRNGFLTVKGAGRSLAYRASVLGRLFFDVSAHDYTSIEPDKRFGLRNYNFEFLPSVPTTVFSPDELRIMDEATHVYNKKSAGLSATLQKKELERLVIELSWKSSKIEGNTYTLLDTEKLILENKEKAGHDKKEARMILNHKDAFMFIRGHASQFKTLTRANMEKVHSILTKGLGVGGGLRKKTVGVTGSIYRPLDNIHQVGEAVGTLSKAVARAKTPYDKSLIALAGISYIQPFEDGNKRTARLMANALLVAHGRAPLSYRSVDESVYREATLVFYELNSLVPIKKIFIEQYDFAARNYAVK